MQPAGKPPAPETEKGNDDTSPVRQHTYVPARQADPRPAGHPEDSGYSDYELERTRQDTPAPADGDPALFEKRQRRPHDYGSVPEEADDHAVAGARPRSKEESGAKP